METETFLSQVDERKYEEQINHLEAFLYQKTIKIESMFLMNSVSY